MSRVATSPLAKSPAHLLHAALGATFVPEAGWEIPASYPQEDERSSLEAVGVADVTARGKVDLQGRVERLVSSAREDEAMARIAADRALLLLPPGPVEPRVAELRTLAGAEAMVTDATHLLAGFALVGPGLGAALERLTTIDVAALQAGTGAPGPFVGVAAVFVRPALPFAAIEVYVGSEVGRYVWEAVLGVCRRLGGGPVGWQLLRERGWR